MSAKPLWLAGRSALVGAILLSALVMGLAAYSLPKDVFWITDGGNRFIQVQSFARFSTSPEIAYPAAGLDPELRFFPFAGHHFQRVGGRIVSYYLPYFALLSLPGYQLAGAAGLGFLPFAAALGILALFPLLLKAAGLPASWRAPATLGLGLCTPLLFYGLTFWEHSLAVFLALAATVLLLRSGKAAARPLFWALAAGFLLGLSTILREEGYVLFVAFVLGYLWAFRGPQARLRAAAFVAGGLGALIPIWFLQERLFGSLFGIHAAAYGGLAGGEGTARLLTELGDLAFFLFRFHPDLRLSFLLSLPFVFVLLRGLRRPRSGEELGWVDLLLLGLAAVAAAILVFLLLRDPQGIFNTLFTQGLLPHTPFLLFALLGLRRALTSPEPASRFLAAAAVLFALAIGIPLNRGDVGIIWGPRHFLALYPLLVTLALLALRDLWARTAGGGRRSTLFLLAMALLLLSFAVEKRGLSLLVRKEQGTARLLTALRAGSTDVVLTDAYWLPEELAALYFERKLLYVESDAAYRDAVDLLSRRGYREATVVLSRGYGELSPQALADIRRRALGGERVASPGLEFLEVAIVRIRVGGQGL